MNLFQKADWLGGAPPGKDRLALPITLTMAAIGAVAIFAPAAVPTWGFTVIRAVICAACLLVFLRRGHLVTSAEMWLLGNFAVLFNPFYQIKLYARAPWIAADVAVAILVGMELYRTDKLNQRWNAIQWYFLLGAYSSWAVLGLVIVKTTPVINNVLDQLLVLPFGLAAGTVLAMLVTTTIVGFIILVSGFFKGVARRLKTLH